MKRFALLITFLALVALPLLAEAQFGRCPFNMQAQYQLQLSWQPRPYIPPQMMMRQARTTQVIRPPQRPLNAIPRTAYPQPRVQTFQRSLTRLTPRPPLMTTSTLRTTTLRPISLRTFQPLPRRLPGLPVRLTALPLRPVTPYTLPVRLVRPTTTVTRTTVLRTQRPLVNTIRTTGVRRTVTTTPLRPLPYLPPRPAPKLAQQKVTTVQKRPAAPQVRHTPRVDLRVKLNMTCGNCHGCKQHQPRPPIALRLPSPNLVPVALPRVVPVDRRTVRLDPPALPPVVRNIKGPAKREMKAPVAKVPERKPEESRPVKLDRPPLPALGAPVTQATLPPAWTPEDRRGRAARPRLLPEQVAEAPAPGALPDAPLMRGLLPAGPVDAIAPRGEPAVTLALVPPTLPPLSDRMTR